MINYKLFDIIPSGPKPPREVFCLVEVPKGSSNKYEYHSDWGTFYLDRVLYGAIYFPCEYGVIPQTWCQEDNDPLDIMVLSSFSTFSGCVIPCRPIGLLQMIDSGEQDDKVIAVPTQDLRFNKIKALEDIRAHLRRKITDFWENYSKLQPEKKIKIQGWRDKETAWDKIRAAQKCYQKAKK